jgi:hypothetical protein
MLDPVPDDEGLFMLCREKAKENEERMFEFRSSLRMQ